MRPNVFTPVQENGDVAEIPFCPNMAALKSTIAIRAETPKDLDLGPAFALVIGISEYKHGKKAGQELAPHEFTNLDFAAEDAKLVADRGHAERRSGGLGFPENGPCFGIDLVNLLGFHRTHPKGVIVPCEALRS